MGIRSISFSTDTNKVDKTKKETEIKNFFKIANKYFRETEFFVRTKRLNLSPFSINQELEGSDIIGTIKWLSEFTKNNDIRWLSAPFHLQENKIMDINKIALEILKRYDNVFVNYIIAQNNEINMSGIYHGSKLVKSISKISNNGFENFRFGALFNCEPNAPYFPFTYNDGESGFSIALELIPKFMEIVSNSDIKDIEVIREEIIMELSPVLSEINDICIEIENSSGVKYNGIDCSLAPFPDNDNGSIVNLIEKLGLDGFGGPGTLFFTSYLTNILKNLIIESNIKSIGFNGVMFSLLEDNLLSQKNNKREFSIDSLMAYSTVCGCGLDMIPIPGGVFEDEIASIMLDIASISCVLNKPLGVRLLPIPLRKENEYTNFNHDFLYNTRILNITNRSCSIKLFETKTPFTYLDQK